MKYFVIRPVFESQAFNLTTVSTLIEPVPSPDHGGGRH